MAEKMKKLRKVWFILLLTLTQTLFAQAFSGVPILKECDAVFNPEKKFCYDGGIYNRCDGMSYNPTTHICNGDVAYRALCGSTQYTFGFSHST